MIHRISRKKYRIFAFDLESHNDEESIAKQETSMWLSCFIDENSKMDDESCYDYNMDSVLDKIHNLSAIKGTKENSRPIKNVCIYIWNLSFEWSFILPVLLKRGFEFSEEITKDSENCYNSVSTKTCSSVWEVKLKFDKRDGIIVFRDLSKVFMGKLSFVAKSFDLPTQKGEIDYRLNRLHNYVVTKEEKEYCFKDTRIIIDILIKMIDKGDNDFWNSISSASYSTKRMIKRGYPRSIKPYKDFRESYPEIDENSEEGIFLRKTIGGGITYAPARYQFKVINNVIGHIDLHQAHPSSAFFHQFPYGRGEYFKGNPNQYLGKICCIHIKIRYDDVKLHSIISLIGIDFVEDRELWIWDFELPLMFECYVNLEVEYIDGYAYSCKPLPWRRYYQDNYMKRSEAKRNGDAFNTMFYKLLNNSSYGKLLERPHNEIFANTIRTDGIIDSDIIDKPLEKQDSCSHYTYIPVGSCIPAWTRVTLVSSALKLGYENVVYFDTDSIFFIWNKKTETAWNTLFNQKDELGGWGWEEFSERSQFTAPKRYKLESNGKTTIKAGGINFNKYMEDRNINQIPFDEVNIITSSWEVQRAYRVKGGTLIEFQTKEMSVQSKYLSIYEKNTYNEEEEIKNPPSTSIMTPF